MYIITMNPKSVLKYLKNIINSLFALSSVHEWLLTMGGQLQSGQKGKHVL